MKTSLAGIAFALRFYNMTEEEEAAHIPAPWGPQNIPQPVSVSSHTLPKIGRNPGGLTYTETVETFSDGSSFAQST